MRKGDKLYVEGRVEYRQYEDKEKQTRYVTEVNVREVILLSPKGGGLGGSDGADAPQTRAKAGEKGKGSAGADFEEFPNALEEADDDLPF